MGCGGDERQSQRLDGARHADLPGELTMSVAGLFNVPEKDEDFLVFSFANADQHALIVDRIFATKGVLLPSFVLDPIPSSDPITWLAVHQEAHNAFTAALGIAGVDLTAVDFRDPEQASSWARLHGE